MVTSGFCCWHWAGRPLVSGSCSCLLPWQPSKVSLAPEDWLSKRFSLLPLHSIHAPLPVHVSLPPLSCDFSELVCHLCVWLSPFAFQLMLLHTIPMCSAQYERMFNTSRVPGVDTGRVLSSASSSHHSYCTSPWYIFLLLFRNWKYYKLIELIFAHVQVCAHVETNLHVPDILSLSLRMRHSSGFKVRPGTCS